MSNLSSSETSNVHPCHVNIATLVAVRRIGRSGGISAPNISADPPLLFAEEEDEPPRRVTVQVIPNGTSIRSSDSGGRVCRVWLGASGGRLLDAMMDQNFMILRDFDFDFKVAGK